MNRCVILCASPTADCTYLSKIICKNDYIICADGGMKYAKKIGIVPQIWIGDFDSSVEEKTSVEVLKYPPEKDDTDTLLAVKEGIKRGYRNFLLLASTGGRLDHTIANIMVLNYLLTKDCFGKIQDEKNILFLIHNDQIQLSPRKGWKFSVFPWNGDAKGVSIRNAAYNVENLTLYTSYPIGISNEFTDDKAIIEVLNGTLLVCLSKD